MKRLFIRNHFGVTPPNRPRADRSITVGAALALLACAAAAPAVAEEPAAGAGAPDGSFTVSPYSWAAGIEGTAATVPGLPPAGVDISLGDIFDDLKPSGMVFFTANKGSLGLAADG